MPAEIAEKIVEKILAGEEFRAYIVIPLHPEGDPATMPLQVPINQSINQSVFIVIPLHPEGDPAAMPLQVPINQSIYELMNESINQYSL